MAPTSTHIPVDLTPAQRAALAALAQQLGISADTITLIGAEAVAWPNGCLGVVHLGVMCTQNVVQGFRIVLAASGQKYEFHTNQDGTAVAYADPNAPFTPTNTHVPVDLTSAQRAALAALAKQLGVSADMIQLVSTEAMEWPNGCMGVIHIGVMCTQNVVQGFRIILSVTDQTYEFHTNQDGSAAVYAAPGAPFLRLAVQAADHSLQIVDTQIGAGINNMAAETGLLPLGGASGASVYGLSVTDKPAAVAVNSSGSRPLDFINTNYGLAVFPGGAGSGPMLAWGASLSADTRQTQLFTGLPDGSQVQALLTEAISTPQAYQLVAERWAADGKSLYFSREPYGLGGYILFSGASSLYKVNLADKQVTEVIPIDFKAAHFICLDALSLDARMVADHCTPNVITIRDLSAQTATAIQPPAEITDAAMLGSARFSPDGQRVAFAWRVATRKASRAGPPCRTR